MAEEWITTKEAAAISGYHAEYLRQLLQQGKIAGKKFGPIWQVSRDSLTAYLDQAQASDDKRHGPK